jgi:cardiolipin synthase
MRLRSSHWPNLLSFARLLVAPPLFVLLLEGRLWWSLGLFAGAAVTDALDGFLAKRHAWQSATGAFLDPLADKLLIVSTFAALVLTGTVPPWLFWTVWGRDAAMGLGVLVCYARRGPFQVVPTRLSKVNTSLQILYLILTLVILLRKQPFPVWWINCSALVAVITVLSGIEYLIRFWNRKNHEPISD